jgi:tRNA (cmo5U34)-methyltransferase
LYLYGESILPKSTVDQIRERFDNSVERFSNLETANVAQVDARLCLDLIAEAAAATNPNAKSVLDVGCGAGNYTLKLMEHLPNLDSTLLDLSTPMLERARERVSQATTGSITLLQGDVRETDIGVNVYDVILASAVLHHLREDEEWRAVFDKLYAALRPGGTLWIYDLIQQTMPEVESSMMRRYADYLTALNGDGYRETVLGWIDMEDTPRPLMYQLDLMRAVGFRETDVLHKHTCFAAFGGRK